MAREPGHDRSARAAAVQRDQKRRETTRTVAIVAAVVVVLVAIVLGGTLLGGGDDTGGASSAAGAPRARVSGDALVVGNDARAPHTVVVYEDFLCPYCRQFESASRDFLRREAKAGAVLVEYRPFHLLQDDYSTRALTAWGAVLRRGTPAQALSFHDALYENQPYEAATDKPDTAALADLAEKSGVTTGSVLDALGTPDQAFVDRTDAAAQKAGVTGTPTVLVDGQELQGSTSQVAAQVKKIVAAG